MLFRHVDTYHNPHMYTKNSLSRAAGENQYALGRILGLEVRQISPFPSFSIQNRN